VNNNLMLNFQSPIKSTTLTFEDNGKVAYAYLKDDGNIIGDVWLYNHTNIETPEWNDIKNIPFLNPEEYIDVKGIMQKSLTMHDVLVNWEKDGNMLVAYIYIFEDLYGVVGVGDKPGYARFAIKNGPLAKIMR